MEAASSESFKCWGVIPAAGIGSRMGSETPKQYLDMAGATVLEHSLAALLTCDVIDTVVVALNPDNGRAAQLPGLINDRVRLTAGGEQRSDSVLAGLLALADMASAEDWVLVHDAARPCVAPEDIAALVRAVKHTGVGGILGEPIVHTVKRCNSDNRVVETLERDQLWCAQTPQMFQIGRLREALELAKLNGISITDEASAMEFAGEEVQIVPGSSRNLKITVAQDLPLATFYLAQLHAGLTR